MTPGSAPLSGWIVRRRSAGAASPSVTEICLARCVAGVGATSMEPTMFWARMTLFAVAATASAASAESGSTVGDTTRRSTRPLPLHNAVSNAVGWLAKKPRRIVRVPTRTDRGWPSNRRRSGRCAALVRAGDRLPEPARATLPRHPSSAATNHHREVCEPSPHSPSEVGVSRRRTASLRAVCS